MKQKRQEERKMELTGRQILTVQLSDGSIPEKYIAIIKHEVVEEGVYPGAMSYEAAGWGDTIEDAIYLCFARLNGEE